MKKIVTTATLVIILALALTACASKGSSADAAAAEALTTQSSRLIAEGRLLPVKALDMSFSVTGQVEKVFVKDGDVVKDGQPLAQLVDVPEADAALARARQELVDAQIALDDYKASADRNIPLSELNVILTRSKFKNARDNYLDGRSTERKARMDEAEANLALAEADHEKLVANAGLDPDQLATLEAQFAAAEAAVKSAQAAVDALTLKATMPGMVVDVSLTKGQQVAAGEMVMAVADYSKWIVETDSLTETEVVDVSEGQEVDVVLDALPDTILKGIVTHINERYEEKRGDITYTVTVELSETDPLMRWGMTAAVYFNR